MPVLGIDPGSSGCAVVLSDEGEHLQHFYFKTMQSGKTKRFDMMSANFHFAALQGYDIKRCFVEKVGAMPGQGVTSMFNFGYATGCIEALAVTYGFPFTHITPATWKKEYGFTGADKDAPRVKAALRFPNVPDIHKKAKGQALADAIFIAYSGMGWKF